MILGLACACSAPIAILTAQSSAARNGILIRSGRAVEMLGQFDTIVFDKTATLTGRVGKVVAVQSLLPDVSPEQLLALVASAERPLDHPIAESIVREALEQEMALQPCTEWNYRTADDGMGLGVIAQIAGQVVYAGNARWMEEIGLRVEVLDRPIPGVPEPVTRVYVAMNGQLAGAILCANPLRPESAEVIARLQRMDKTVIIASGDSSAVVRAIGAELGVNPACIYGDLLPEQKADLVAGLRADGKKVAVVGDGTNDVAAMAHADVSISLGSAGTLARETADVVLLNDDLTDLLLAMQIGRHALRIIEQNQAIVVCTNTAGIAYGALAVLNPIAGVVINNGVALAAALNSLRPIITSEQDESR